jgi:hypothetical protein
MDEIEEIQKANGAQTLDAEYEDEEELRDEVGSTL